jgi:hypothetical protein
MSTYCERGRVAQLQADVRLACARADRCVCWAPSLTDHRARFYRQRGLQSLQKPESDMFERWHYFSVAALLLSFLDAALGLTPELAGSAEGTLNSIRNLSSSAWRSFLTSV